MDFSWWAPENRARRLEAVQQRLATLPWWQEESAHLESDPAAVVHAAATSIDASAELRGRPLSSLLPGLADVPEELSFASHIGTRGARVLRANAADWCGDLVQFSAAEMMTWPECGKKTVAEILFCAIDLWVAVTWDDSNGLSRQHAASAAPPPRRPGTSGHTWGSVRARLVLDALGKAAYRAGAVNVRDAIGLLIEGSLVAAEGSLATGWKAFCSSRLDDLLGLQLDDAWNALLEFDDRALRILEAHAPTNPARLTHARLAQELGISTARVGQIEQHCRRTIADRLQTDACAPIAHHAAHLRRDLGTSVSAAVLDARVRPLLPHEATHPLLCRDVFLEQAGPYRLENGSWKATPLDGRSKHDRGGRRSVGLAVEAR